MSQILRLSSLARLIVCIFLTGSFTSFGAPRITEFMADNTSGLVDEDGERSDWIEIYNPDPVAISLNGYYLTDNAANLNKWRFPAVMLNPGAYLVVFASGKDRVDPAGRLHTDFSLSSGGEFLGLVAPNGTTVVSSFSPAYPEQFENVSFGIGGAAGDPVFSYFSPATPGATNAVGTRAGPVVTLLTKNPPQPTVADLTVTAAVRQLNDPVTAVKLYYRRMFTTEVSLPMADDGLDADAVAGDRIWTAVIPASAFAAGEMTRWRVVATDSKATDTKDPAYRITTDSDQYYGTVPQDPGIETKLPVLHWFTSNPGGANTASGSRGSVYYDGEFYDNVLFNLHGQSSAGFPKHSYNIDFNRGHHFRWSTNAARVADIDLITNWADKSKVRQVFGYEVMRESGVGAHFAYTVRVEQNGNFFSTADFVEDADETYLERAGLNPNGALYKVYANTLNKAGGDTGTTGVEKKTRKFENNADLQALIDGLAKTGTNLNNYIRDNIDIARCVNMLAASSVIRNIDMHSKNWYIYRDTGRSGEWSMLPWDLDLSHGRVWNTQYTYFDNAMYVDGFVVNGTAVRLASLMFSDPAIRTMLMRRIRTLTDRFLQPPPAAGTPESELYYERRLNEQLALIDPPSIVPSDAQRDFQKWGSWLQGGTTVSYTNTNVAVETMAEAVQRFKKEYLPGRRSFIYNTQIVGKGGEIPLPQTGSPTYNFVPLLSAGAPAQALVPKDSTLGYNWIGVPSQEPYDTTDWLNGTTGVGYERGTGYESLIGLDVNSQMATNPSIFVRVEFDVANPALYEQLQLRMKYDDGFVAYLNGILLVATNAPATRQWNSAATGNREADPAVFDVFDITSKRSNLRTGRNVLAIQGLNESTNSSDMLILPEIYGGIAGLATFAQPPIIFGAIDVSPVSGNQDEEFVELKNTNSIAVDISDWKLAGAVEHTFVGGTVIPARNSLYVCSDAAAFRARTASPHGNQGLYIQGGYKGHLSSIGETLVLLDDHGATNATLTYPGAPSDQQRYLVVSEVMYRPPGDGLAEFIELLNISPVTTVDLTGVRFTMGVEFNFTNSPIKKLPPGGRALVVRDRAAFEAIYGTGLPIAGVFSGGTALNNGGERIKIEDPDNLTIRDFTYSNAAPWPTAADGAGYSIILIAPETNPDHRLSANWRASALPGGNPGSTDAVPFPAAPLGDADGNGEADLIDYAFGNNLGKSPIHPTVTIIEGASAPTLRLSYPKSIGAERASIDVFYSTDMLNWEAGAAILEGNTIEQLGDGRVLVNWNIKPDIADDAQLFVRVRVTEK